MILIPDQIREFQKSAESLWWLMSAAEYKQEKERVRTNESKEKFEQCVSEALGNKY